MSGFTIVTGVAEISDPAIYKSWPDNDELKAAVEADLSRMVRSTFRKLASGQNPMGN